MTWVPTSCTPPLVEQPLQVAEFDDLFATVLRRIEQRGTRVYHDRPGRARLGMSAWISGEQYAWLDTPDGDHVWALPAQSH